MPGYPPFTLSNYTNMAFAISPAFLATQPRRFV